MILFLILVKKNVHNRNKMHTGCNFSWLFSIDVLWRQRWLTFRMVITHTSGRTIFYITSNFTDMPVSRVRKVLLTLETGISANFNVRRNVVPPWRVRQAHSGSNSPMTSQNVNAKQSRKVASRVRFKHILHIFRQKWEK